MGSELKRNMIEKFNSEVRAFKKLKNCKSDKIEVEYGWVSKADLNIGIVFNYNNGKSIEKYFISGTPHKSVRGRRQNLWEVKGVLAEFLEYKFNNIRDGIDEEKIKLFDVLMENKIYEIIKADSVGQFIDYVVHDMVVNYGTFIVGKMLTDHKVEVCWDYNRLDERLCDVDTICNRGVYIRKFRDFHLISVPKANGCMQNVIAFGIINNAGRWCSTYYYGNKEILGCDEVLKNISYTGLAEFYRKYGGREHYRRYGNREIGEFRGNDIEKISRVVGVKNVIREINKIGAIL